MVSRIYSLELVEFKVKTEIEIWDKETQTTMYKINKQQGYIVQHRKIESLFCNNFKWSII